MHLSDRMHIVLLFLFDNYDKESNNSDDDKKSENNSGNNVDNNKADIDF